MNRKANMEEKSNDEPRVFDVAKPGKSGPSATSKPIIVGHKSMIEDPMVKTGASATLDEEAKEIADDKVSDETKNEASDNTKSEDKKEVGPHQAKVVEPPEETTKTEETPVEAPAPAAEPAAVPDEPSEPKEPAASDSDTPDQTAKSDEKETKVSEEEQAQQVAIQKLIEDKQYVVHVGEAHHHKPSRKVMIIAGAAVVLLVGLATYLLL